MHGSKTRASFVLLGLAVSGATTVACGEKHLPPLAGDDIVSGTSGDASGGGAFGSTSNTVPPACDTLADGGSCGCVDVLTYEDPPALYFVLDRSGSMQDDNKWTTVRATIASLIRSIGPRADFGAAMFPAASGSDACATGAEVMSVRAGDPPTANASANGPTTAALLAATNLPASGGTPTAATLDALLPKLIAAKGAKGANGKVFVVLATDGGPNCDDALACAPAKCIPNIEGVVGCDATTNCCAAPVGTPEDCLDDQATILAVNKLTAEGIPTYVVGVPGSGPYASVLDALAVAGGTAQTSGTAKYYPVDTADEAALLTTLRTVAAKVTATCTFRLSGAPDPALVNVFFDEVVVPMDPLNGWTITNGVVTLQGTSCSRVTNGDVLDVRIIAGCPTVVR